MLVGDRQHIAFVDPKGIRNVPMGDPKIRFHETIKEIEKRLGNPKVALNSYIVPNTPSHTIRMLWRIEKADMQQRHILFQEEDKHTYVQAMLAAVGV